MESAEGVRLMFAVALCVIGLSHMFRASVWRRFFIDLADRGEAGAFANALIHLAPGLLVIGLHRVYEGPMALLTALGWAWVAKSAVYLLFPAAGVKMMERGGGRSESASKLAGVAMLAFAILLAVSLWPGPNPFAEILRQ